MKNIDRTNSNNCTANNGGTVHKEEFCDSLCKSVHALNRKLGYTWDYAAAKSDGMAFHWESSEIQAGHHGDDPIILLSRVHNCEILREWLERAWSYYYEKSDME